MVALLLIFLISFSRLYLGMHFPSDVLLGWVIGGLLLWALIKLEPPVKKWLAGHSFGEGVLAAFGASLVCIVIAALVRLVFSAWIVPTDWISNARLATEVEEAIEPLSLSGMFSNGGAFFGLALGAMFIQLVGGYSTRGTPFKQVARLLIGLAGILLFWRVLGSLLPRGEYLLAYIFRYLRYALIGFWVTGLAPYLFLRTGLAEKLKADQPEAEPVQTA
jgi:hypothetical protein